LHVVGRAGDLPARRADDCYFHGESKSSGS
jgi:hypothetical protein